MSGDDPEAYLRPSKDRDTVDQTRMFDSKKWTWVTDEEEGFKSATVKSQKGERVLVEFDNGEVTYKLANLHHKQLLNLYRRFSYSTYFHLLYYV